MDMDLALYRHRRRGGVRRCGGTGQRERRKAKQEAGDSKEEERRKMTAGNGGALNPTWVEWLMGWPLGWTVLDAAATEWFHSKPAQHGKNS